MNIYRCLGDQVATTEARELAERHIMVSYQKEYAGGWKHPFIDASVATSLDAVMKDRFLIGGPDLLHGGGEGHRSSPPIGQVTGSSSP